MPILPLPPPLLLLLLLLLLFSPAVSTVATAGSAVAPEHGDQIAPSLSSSSALFVRAFRKETLATVETSSESQNNDTTNGIATAATTTTVDFVSRPTATFSSSGHSCNYAYPRSLKNLTPPPFLVVGVSSTVSIQNVRHNHNVRSAWASNCDGGPRDGDGRFGVSFIVAEPWNEEGEHGGWSFLLSNLRSTDARFFMDDSDVITFASLLPDPFVDSEFLATIAHFPEDESAEHVTFLLSDLRSTDASFFMDDSDVIIFASLPSDPFVYSEFLAMIPRFLEDEPAEHETMPALLLSHSLRNHLESEESVFVVPTPVSWILLSGCLRWNCTCTTFDGAFDALATRLSFGRSSGADHIMVPYSWVVFNRRFAHMVQALSMPNRLPKNLMVAGNCDDSCSSSNATSAVDSTTATAGGGLDGVVSDGVEVLLEEDRLRVPQVVCDEDADARDEVAELKRELDAAKRNIEDLEREVKRQNSKAEEAEKSWVVAEILYMNTIDLLLSEIRGVNVRHAEDMGMIQRQIKEAQLSASFQSSMPPKIPYSSGGISLISSTAPPLILPSAIQRLSLPIFPKPPALPSSGYSAPHDTPDTSIPTGLPPSLWTSSPSFSNNTLWSWFILIAVAHFLDEEEKQRRLASLQDVWSSKGAYPDPNLDVCHANLLQVVKPQSTAMVPFVSMPLIDTCTDLTTVTKNHSLVVLHHRNIATRSYMMKLLQVWVCKTQTKTEFYNAVTTITKSQSLAQSLIDRSYYLLLWLIVVELQARGMKERKELCATDETNDASDIASTTSGSKTSFVNKNAASKTTFSCSGFRSGPSVPTSFSGGVSTGTSTNRSSDSLSGSSKPSSFSGSISGAPILSASALIIDPRGGLKCGAVAAGLSLPCATAVLKSSSSLSGPSSVTIRPSPLKGMGKQAGLSVGAGVGAGSVASKTTSSFYGLPSGSLGRASCPGVVSTGTSTTRSSDSRSGSAGSSSFSGSISGAPTDSTASSSNTDPSGDITNPVEVQNSFAPLLLHTSTDESDSPSSLSGEGGLEDDICNFLTTLPPSAMADLCKGMFALKLSDENTRPPALPLSRTSLVSSRVSYYTSSETPISVHSTEAITQSAISPSHQDVNSVRDLEFAEREPLGKGSFGEVFLVRMKRSKQVFALKKQTLVHDAELEEKIMRELDHPFIVKCHSSFLDSGGVHTTHMMLLNYYPGGVLSSHKWNTKPGMESHMRFFFSGLIEALNYMHSKGVVHRDLKPENVAIDGEGYAVILDLGLAKRTKDDEMIHEFRVGTVPYMAPEVIDEEQGGYDNRADYWSLGVMLYELIYGVLPFWPTGKLSTYRDPRDRMLAFTEAIFQDIKTSNYAFHEKPYASAECKDLIDKLLVVDINQRLGGGVIKNHPWFANKMDWTKLNNKELEPPFTPEGAVFEPRSEPLDESQH